MVQAKLGMYLFASSLAAAARGIARLGALGLGVKKTDLLDQPAGSHEMVWDFEISCFASYAK